MRRSWSSTFPEEHKIAWDKVDKHTTLHPVENLAALTQTKTRALHRELVQDVHDGLPKEWKNWKSSGKSAADIFVCYAKLKIRLEKEQGACHVSVLCQKGGHRFDRNKELTNIRLLSKTDPDELVRNPPRSKSSLPYVASVTMQRKRQRLEEGLITSVDDCNRRDILKAKFKADHYKQVVSINRKRDYGTSLTVEEQSVWDADQEYEDWVQLLRRRSSLAHAKALSLADPL